MRFQALDVSRKKETLEILLRSESERRYQESAKESKEDASTIDRGSVDTNRVEHHVYLLLRSHEEGCAAKQCQRSARNQ